MERDFASPIAQRTSRKSKMSHLTIKAEVIDGRQAVTAHGTRDMPIWGTQYLAEADFYYHYMEGMGPHTREPFVRARIMALVDYLNRIQVK
jgi:hypothetical protein